jgi:anti-sigma28 factor (negative regulator of flagellin synthesis)
MAVSPAAFAHYPHGALRVHKEVIMANINSIQPSMGMAPIDAMASVATNGTKVQPAGISDVVEISNVAKLAAKIQEVPDIRTELVEQVKAEIAAGTYETPERIEIALDRLMDELFPNM